jgi:phosphatidylserine/phosphatidylglycerophosphate/cardiolipin synthase-like enzyme
VVEFLGAAERTLDLALYDIRLQGEAGDAVSAAFVAAHERGVRVRLVYNADDHRGPIPVPPPPQTEPELLNRLPIETKPIPGEPDLMHHKYAIRDGRAVWTGSLNWTDDSWSRQENVVVVAESPQLAHAFTLNFEELWEGELNAENVLELRDAAIAGGLAAFVDEIRALYPRVTLAPA